MAHINLASSWPESINFAISRFGPFQPLHGPALARGGFLNPACPLMALSIVPLLPEVDHPHIGRSDNKHDVGRIRTRAHHPNKDTGTESVPKHFHNVTPEPLCKTYLARQEWGGARGSWVSADVDRCVAVELCAVACRAAGVCDCAPLHQQLFAARSARILELLSEPQFLR